MEAKIYKCHPDAIIPKVQEEDSVGFDLHAIEDFELYQGQRHVVGTGLVVQPPPGYHTEIIIRSGMSYKYNVMLINSVGVIDRSYAGPTDELKIMLYRASVANDRRGAIKFSKGDRVAQLVFRKTEKFKLVEIEQPPSADRGGFGSTGQ